MCYCGDAYESKDVIRHLTKAWISPRLRSTRGCSWASCGSCRAHGTTSNLDTDFVIVWRSRNYYTKCLIIRELPNPSPSCVAVNAAKQIFAEIGIPDWIVSDNGPHLIAKPTVIWHGHGSVIISQLHLDTGKWFYRMTSENHRSLAKKIEKSGKDCQLAFLHWHTTPINANLAFRTDV